MLLCSMDKVARHAMLICKPGAGFGLSSYLSSCSLSHHWHCWPTFKDWHCLTAIKGDLRTRQKTSDSSMVCSPSVKLQEGHQHWDLSEEPTKILVWDKNVSLQGCLAYCTHPPRCVRQLFARWVRKESIREVPRLYEFMIKERVRKESLWVYDQGSPMDIGVWRWRLNQIEIGVVQNF